MSPHEFRLRERKPRWDLIKPPSSAVTGLHHEWHQFFQLRFCTEFTHSGFGRYGHGGISRIPQKNAKVSERYLSMLKERSTPIGRLYAKALIFLYALVLIPISYWAVLKKISAEPSFDQVTIGLKRDKFTVYEYPAQGGQPSAIILFASGDGGWNPLEDMVAHALQQHGFEVIGIDSAAYAASDYDLDTLQSDFAQIAHWAESSFSPSRRPLIVGGYSMGAAQAVAVAAGPHPPSGMIGLLVMDPLSRGRYGLRNSDQLNVLPTGPGTFSVDECAPKVRNVRVVAWHAANDPIDSRSWLSSLSVPYEELDLPGASHGYDVGRDAFLVQLVASADWILKQSPQALAKTENKD